MRLTSLEAPHFDVCVRAQHSETLARRVDVERLDGVRHMVEEAAAMHASRHRPGESTSPHTAQDDAIVKVNEHVNCHLFDAMTEVWAAFEFVLISMYPVRTTPAHF